MSTPPVDIVRRALRRAVDVARAGEREQPGIPAPAALRPVLRFRRLPPAALDTVAAVLDTDECFRARVAAAIDEQEVGRVATLWLQRPAGWEREVTRLLAEHTSYASDTPGADPNEEHRVRRQLEGAERAASRASKQAVKLEAELQRMRSQLAALRTDRDELAARCAELERTVRDLGAQRATAVAELKRAEGLLVRRTEQRRALEQKLEELSAPPAAATAPHDAPLATDAVRQLVLRLVRATQALTGDVEAIRSELGFTPEPPRVDPTGARARRRVPLAIPPGLTDDSVEAAAYLLAQPRAVLLVDGYNVSMAAWPEAGIADQRARLERLLADLAARSAGLTVDIVFDGADVAMAAQPGARRAPGVTVRFTASDVEADDVVLDLVDRYPVARPVLVASSDRRVRDGARRRGANVVSATQLLAAARL